MAPVEFLQVSPLSGVSPLAQRALNGTINAPLAHSILFPHSLFFEEKDPEHTGSFVQVEGAIQQRPASDSPSPRSPNVLPP